MTQSNLANAYSNRIHGDRADNAERAVEHYQLALEVLTREAFPDEHRRIQRNLVNLHFEDEYWAEAVATCEGALAACDLLYEAAATQEARWAELRETRDLPPRLTYASSKRVGGDADVLLRQAVLILERNRARWLSEGLALHGQKPQAVSQDVWQTFVARRERVQELQAEAHLPESAPGKRDFLVISKDLGTARIALGEAIAHIRHHDGTFLPAPTFDQIRDAVSSPEEEERGKDALVYFAVTPAGTVALIVDSAGIHPVWCALTEDALREYIAGPPGVPELGYLGAYDRWWQSPDDPRTHQVWRDALDDATRWLWDVLMGPIVETLVELGVEHVALVPQGWLGLLPLHAAWTGTDGDRRYAMDEVCFAYTPNARALSTARQTAARVSPDRIFAVDEPQPVSGVPLPNSAQEVFAACSHFPQTQRTVLADEEATLEAVREQLPLHSVLHFSCHGQAGFAQPLDGGLLMAYGQMLTLRDVLTQRLENTRLAILSACETGVPADLDLPDEVISLPSGLAQAGVAGVVASLWSVSDLSTMMLMARFYESWKKDGLRPAEALRQAQRWVRDATNYNFTHPFYWAAFTYTGV